MRHRERPFRHAGLVAAAHDDIDQSHVRRVGGRAAERQLALRKPRKIVGRRGHERVMPRLPRLHHDFPTPGPAPRPARHLRHQLKRPLRRAEVGQVERRVGIDHPDQGNPRKVESLGNHLRTEQQVDLAARECVENSGV